VWEQDFINPEKSFLVVNEKLKKITLVLIGEIGDLDSVLSQFCKFQQTLLKFSCFFGVLLNLLVLFLIHDFIFESSLHNTFSNFFNTFHKEAFKLILLADLIDFFKACLLILLLFLVNDNSEVLNGLIVICFQKLNVLENLFFDLFTSHLRLVDEVNEALELQVFCWNELVSAGGTSRLSSSGLLFGLHHRVCKHKTWSSS